MARVWVLALVVALGGCGGDALAPQPSPDGRFVLTPSLHEGSLIRLTVRERSSGRVVDDVKTRDTDAMKWVAGWTGDSRVVFWGADTGAAWVRPVGGPEAGVDEAACRMLEAMFALKYGEQRGHCLAP